MENELPELILASQSPRRRQILEALGLRFRVVPSSAEEKSGTSKEVAAIVMGNAFVKAKEVLERSAAGAVVLGADTVVVLDDAVLGKPGGEEDARRMLRSLSGRTHSVFTGMALASREKGELKSCVRTEIRFKTLSADDIENYLKTKEPFDKAGAYGVQGVASLFVKSIDGSYTNVMGLPIEQLLKDLEAFTGLPPWRWIGT
jgi:septum formation protein